MTDLDPVEQLWDGLLSRDPQQIQSVFRSLNDDEKAFVVSHLNRMVSEDGWHPEQVISATAALQAIQELP